MPYCTQTPSPSRSATIAPPESPPQVWPLVVASAHITVVELKQPSTLPTSYSVEGCFNSATVICAKATSSGQTCGGDSGGAVVADRNGDGVWVQYGIVSIGLGPNGPAKCGERTHLGYTDVSIWTDQLMNIIIANN